MLFKKKYLIIFSLFLLLLIISGLSLLNANNSFSKKIKDNTPNQIKILLKNSIFYIPIKFRELNKLKIENENLKQYTRDLDLENKSLKNQMNFGKSSIDILNFKNDYKLTKYVLPFYSKKSLYANKDKGYLDLYENYILVFFGSGKSILIEIETLNNKKFIYQELNNNLNKLKLFDQKIKWTGIKDIKIDEDKVYVSLTKDYGDNCYQTEIFVSEFNTKELIFKDMKTNNNNTCAAVNSVVKSYPSYKNFNGYQNGGRIVTDSDNIYFTIGDYNQWDRVQDLDNNFGKILKIDKKHLNHKIISKGHRNQQGMYLVNSDIILTTEHGPKGGDEINLLNINDESVQNFGWPISSYGNHYESVPLNKAINKIAPLNKQHEKFGFIEPIYYFKNSIGISEIIKNYYSSKNSFFVTSLKEKKIYEIEFGDNFKNPKIIDEINVGERIRDIIYNKEENKYYLYLESTPNLAILENSN